VPVIFGRCGAVRLLPLLLHGLSQGTTENRQGSGMIIFVSVSMFDHKPERCPFGHSLWPDRAQVG